MSEDQIIARNILAKFLQLSRPLATDRINRATNDQVQAIIEAAVAENATAETIPIMLTAILEGQDAAEARHELQKALAAAHAKIEALHERIAELTDEGEFLQTIRDSQAALIGKLHNERMEFRRASGVSEVVLEETPPASATPPLVREPTPAEQPPTAATPAEVVPPAEPVVSETDPIVSETVTE